MVEHAYAVGRLRALEARMLNESQVTRMVEASDLQSAFQVLSETPYAEKIDRLPPPFDFEDLLKQGLISVQRLLDALAPRDEILDIIFKKYDYHNLKVVLKSRITGLPPQKALYEVCTLPLHELERLEICKKAELISSQNQDLRAIEDLIDQEYIKILKEAAARHRVPLFSEYVKVFSVTASLKIGLRSGKLDKEEALKDYRYTDFAGALDRFTESGNLFVLERELDDLLLRKIEKARYFTFGIEPLIGFLHAKEVELKILRLILVAKLNRIGTELIKERLRTSYV